jgi:hypothetical protein
MDDYGLSRLDEILVQRTILAMICDVDLLQFDAAERLFAPEVEVDYTSLWGGAPAKMTAAQLIGSWRGLLPGFDATWHELGDIEVKASGATARASCSVAARHWIGTALWLPKGRYELTLVKTDMWRISQMRLVMSEELGDRALVTQAQGATRRRVV